MYQSIQSTIKTQGYEPHKNSIVKTVIQFKQMGYSKNEILETLNTTYNGCEPLLVFIDKYVNSVSF